MGPPFSRFTYPPAKRPVWWSPPNLDEANRRRRDCTQARKRWSWQTNSSIASPLVINPYHIWNESQRLLLVNRLSATPRMTGTLIEPNGRPSSDRPVSQIGSTKRMDAKPNPKLLLPVRARVFVVYLARCLARAVLRLVPYWISTVLARCLVCAALRLVANLHGSTESDRLSAAEYRSVFESHALTHHLRLLIEC
jgi:hypothetical protein